jgi:hypothetical protein
MFGGSKSFQKGRIHMSQKAIIDSQQACLTSGHPILNQPLRAFYIFCAVRIYTS